MIYVAAAALFGAICLWSQPLAITSGASGAVFGIYGLLVALVVRGTWQRSRPRVPLRVVRRLGPAAAMFIGYYMADGGPRWSAGLAAFVVAFAVGLALTRGLAERKPGTPRVLWLATTPLSIAMMLVAPLNGMTDVRTEIANLVAVDSQTSAIYLAATEQFKRGALNAKSLALLIEHRYRPQTRSRTGPAERRRGRAAAAAAAGRWRQRIRPAAVRELGAARHRAAQGEHAAAARRRPERARIARRARKDQARPVSARRARRTTR